MSVDFIFHFNPAQLNISTAVPMASLPAPALASKAADAFFASEPEE